jgi:hypothetical protein
MLPNGQRREPSRAPNVTQAVTTEHEGPALAVLAAERPTAACYTMPRK